MRLSRKTQAAGAWGHLLLVVVLALGIFVMHTLGHPKDTSGTGATMEMGAAAHGAAMSASADHGMHAAATPVVVVSPHASDHDAKAPSHAPGSGMDMTSLCVAVLGTWALAGLLWAALRRRADWLVRLRAGLLVVLRPEPPPRRPLLARLSVLRI
ncbi:hypothetical protein [Streptomyces niger]|uniref:hypothetical protein n=1 Tax=Streptomyces niger TaxID=66373 RepID=UPI00069BF98D|nr:hypothetical protein [Streptomyces niger]